MALCGPVPIRIRGRASSRVGTGCIIRIVVPDELTRSDLRRRIRIQMTKITMAFPNGRCYCGCGGETGMRTRFLRGHDRKAMEKILHHLYPGLDTAQIMVKLGLIAKA